MAAWDFELGCMQQYLESALGNQPFSSPQMGGRPVISTSLALLLALDMAIGANTQAPSLSLQARQ